MYTWNAHERLEVWEAGACQHPIDRALTLLAADRPELSRDALADLPLGRRDAELLALYAALFGDELTGFYECPQCGEGLELPFSVAELSRLGDGGAAAEELDCDGVELRFRRPTSRDLAAAAVAATTQSARRLLAERCVVEARRGGAPLAAAELPDAVVDGLSERLAEVDPGAEILIGIDCPECGERASRILDVGVFLWHELGLVTRGLLAEIGCLARGFGWSEAEILSMSPSRRRTYLEMLPS